MLSGDECLAVMGMPVTDAMAESLRVTKADVTMLTPREKA